MYKEMMTNDDNVEFSLLTSSLLKICSLYNLPLFILLVSITVYTEVQWVAYEHSQ